MAELATTSEFHFTDRDFQRVRRILKTRAGIDLGDQKQALVYGRLARRLRALRIGTFEAYLDLVESAGSPETDQFVNSLTTNVTAFFREPHHFEALSRTVLPALWRKNAATGRVRIWSAGCSTGQEPYTIAMTVRETPPPTGNWDIKILATDLDSQVLAHGSAGIYETEAAESIGAARVARFFQRGEGENSGHMRVKPELRSLITFKQLNLMTTWPMKGPFDVIFCRNVVIYFDDETKQRLIRRYEGMLDDGGHLFLGHSESLVSAGTSFEPCGKTMYRKAGAKEAA